MGNEQYSAKTPISNISEESGIIEAKVEGGRVLEATLHVGRSKVSLNVIPIKQENSTRIDDIPIQEVTPNDNTDSKSEQEGNTRTSDTPIQEITPDDNTHRKSEQESNARAGGASKQGATPDENYDRIDDPVQDYIINRITYLEKMLPIPLGRETLKVLNLDHDVMICDMRAGRLNITVFTRNENTADNVRHYNRKEDIPDNTKIDMLLYFGCDEGTIETLTAFLRQANPKLLSFDMSKVANHS